MMYYIVIVLYIHPSVGPIPGFEQGLADALIDICSMSDDVLYSNVLYMIFCIFQGEGG